MAGRGGIPAGLVVVGLGLALAACGGGGAESSGHTPPTRDAIACLTGSGAAAEILSEESGAQLIGAHAAGGDSIFVLNLPNPSISEAAVEAMRKAVRRAGGISDTGQMTAATVNDGWTLVAVVGVRGVDGGVASKESETIAKQCASLSFVESHAKA